MGNKLCAPWRRGFRDDGHPWAPKKDSHLLRLWAEIFEVRGAGDEMCWARVSDDVVPVNMTCIQDTPETVFQITAYNRHVEKIFDVKLIQPGTCVTQPSDCFVHWRDSRYENEWGLNFTTPLDARRFRECSTTSAAHKLARKATSSGSLRLSPPKRERLSARRGTSNPTSPVSQPRRAVSTPEELTFAEAERNELHDKTCSRQHVASPYAPNGAASSIYDTVAAAQRTRMGTTSLYRQRSQGSQDFVDAYYQTGTGDAHQVNAPPPPEVDRKPEVRQLSREPTVLRIGSEHRAQHGAASLGRDADLRSIHVELGEMRTPDWPEPPEPPSLENGASATFDSCTLQRMLRNLPKQPSDDNEREETRLPRTLERQVATEQTPGGSPASQRYNMPPAPPHRVTSYSTSGLEPPAIVSTRSSPPPSYGRLELEKVEHYATVTRKEGGRSVHYEVPVDWLPGRGAHRPYSTVARVSSHSTAELYAQVEPRHRRRVQRHDSQPEYDSHRDIPNVSEFYAAVPPPTERARSFDCHRRRTVTDGTHSDGGYRSKDVWRRSASLPRGVNSRSAGESDGESEGGASSGGATSDSSIQTMEHADALAGSGSNAVRKAGWLHLKNWLSQKKRRLELSPKRGWKRYWACLRGTSLLVFSSAESDKSSPRHVIVAEAGMAQRVPEHPKRDNTFALSTATGDAFLLQADTSGELDDWIRALHSACASSYARQHGRENTLKLLRNEIQKLENSIDIDIKMKKMADLQMAVVTDARNKQAIERQIRQWDENLEKLYMEQYRLRCYMASLRNDELPNPKNLMSSLCKDTKSVLLRVGVFNVTSLHALICARAPRPVLLSGSCNRRQGRLLSTFKAETNSRARSPMSAREAHENSHILVDLQRDSEDLGGGGAGGAGGELIERCEHTLRVAMPPCTNSVLVTVTEKSCVQDVIEQACDRRQLNPRDHYLLYRTNSSVRIPERLQHIDILEHEVAEVAAKILFQLELDKQKIGAADFGMTVEAELSDDGQHEDALCVFICDVKRGGLASQRGLEPGDEILVLDGRVVSQLDMVFVETVLSEQQRVCLTLRSCRVKPPSCTASLHDHADRYIDHLTCPPPPEQPTLSETLIDSLIVPKPLATGEETETEDESSLVGVAKTDVSKMTSAQIDTLLQGAEQVTHFCRLMHAPSAGKPALEELPASNCRQLSDAQKLRKVVVELLDTERQYVKDLGCLLERYLEPLKDEPYLSGEDVQQLFGNIRDIVDFQQQFVLALADAVNLEPDFRSLDTPDKFKRVLFSIGGSFLHYTSHFKLYSSFCAAHSKALKLLNPDGNPELREFLRARNPKQQHSATLESYLIKPIQRILKYPLLLAQLKSLTRHGSDEHQHLGEALRSMEAVAEHINEMQKIYEEYGAVFDELIRHNRDAHPQRPPLELNVGDLQMYGTVTWLNAYQHINKVRKGHQLVTTIFVFKSGIVILGQEKAKLKKNKRVPPPDAEVLTRFQGAVPVDQIQVRLLTHGDSERHGLWELVHSRSETEGRPEYIFQFASSHGARNEFIKTIRNTVRDGGRPSSLNGTSCATSSQHHRPESLPATTSLGRPQRGRLSQSDDRHYSVDLDNGVLAGRAADVHEENACGEMRGRSRTFSDLNNPVDDQYTLENTMTSENRSVSARLLHSSHDPASYSESAENAPRDRQGSPIWKPRSAKPSVGPGSPRQHRCSVAHTSTFAPVDRHASDC